MNNLCRELNKEGELASASLSQESNFDTDIHFGPCAIRSENRQCFPCRKSQTSAVAKRKTCRSGLGNEHSCCFSEIAIEIDDIQIENAEHLLNRLPPITGTCQTRYYLGDVDRAYNSLRQVCLHSVTSSLTIQKCQNC